MNRKDLIIVFLLTVLLMGCSADKDEIKRVAPTLIPGIERKSDQLSEMMDWNDVKIVESVFYPRFQEGTVVQNDKYIFYPDSGNRIIRIEKQTREKKCILELDEIKEKGTGAQICIAEDGLMVEYECNIFRCDLDGNKMEKIIGDVDVKKTISSVIHESVENISSIMSGIQFYNGNLYLFSSWDCIWKLDPDSAEFTRIAENAQTACFNNNNLYYGDSGFQCIYRVDLETGKRVRIKGENGKTDTDSEKQVLYTDVMVVGNQIYYICGKKGKKPSLYLYCEGGKDEKLFTFQKSPWSSHVGLTRVFLEYYDFDREMSYLQAYDIKTRKDITMEMPNDYQTAAFVAGDILFYTNRDSENTYLSTFMIPEEGWEEKN